STPVRTFRPGAAGRTRASLWFEPQPAGVHSSALTLVFTCMIRSPLFGRLPGGPVTRPATPRLALLPGRAGPRDRVGITNAGRNPSPRRAGKGRRESLRTVPKAGTWQWRREPGRPPTGRREPRTAEVAEPMHRQQPGDGGEGVDTGEPGGCVLDGGSEAGGACLLLSRDEQGRGVGGISPIRLNVCRGFDGAGEGRWRQVGLGYRPGRGMARSPAWRRAFHEEAAGDRVVVG